MKTKKKEFDCVEMMREIRAELSDKYLKNPELKDRDLEKIREKYNIKDKELSAK